MEIEKYDLLDDTSNGIYSFFKSSIKIIYNKSNMDVFKSFYNFFADLRSSQQNMNYLYEFFEKIRTSTYELQAKLLARLIVELVKNKGLTYFESNLLANINIFNDMDINRIYIFLKEYENEESDSEVKFNFDNFNYTNTFNKSIQIGIIEDLTGALSFNELDKKRSVQEFKICYLTPYSNEFLILLDDILGANDLNI